MDKTIRSITEAFSIQPASFYVGMLWSNKGNTVAKIVEESVYINGDPFDYYVGYDTNGNKLFESKKGTVNVTYEV
jgi:hypothetical protein